MQFMIFAIKLGNILQTLCHSTPYSCQGTKVALDPFIICAFQWCFFLLKIFTEPVLSWFQLGLHDASYLSFKAGIYAIVKTCLLWLPGLQNINSIICVFLTTKQAKGPFHHGIFHRTSNSMESSFFWHPYTSILVATNVTYGTTALLLWQDQPWHLQQFIVIWSQLSN